MGIGAIISPNTYVTYDIPPYAIVEGNPAKIVGYRFDESTIEKLLVSKWWLFDPSDISGIDFSDIESALNDINTLKLHFKLRNETLFKTSMSNNASLSKTGIIWISTPYSYADENILEKFTTLTINSVKNDPDSTSDIESGEYKIFYSTYDKNRGWYKIKLLVNENEYSGKLDKNSINFKFS